MARCGGCRRTAASGRLTGASPEAGTHVETADAACWERGDLRRPVLAFRGGEDRRAPRTSPLRRPGSALGGVESGLAAGADALPGALVRCDGAGLVVDAPGGSGQREPDDPRRRLKSHL